MKGGDGLSPDLVSSLAIYEGTMDASANGTVAAKYSDCSHVGSAEPDLSVLGIVHAVVIG